MAEFQEVVRERKRMCNSVGNCNNCPLSGSPCEIDENILNNPKKIEKIIMQWAKEHPPKTNADKFKEVFGIEISKTHKCFEDKCPKDDQMCEDCYYTGFWNKEYEEPSEE